MATQAMVGVGVNPIGMVGSAVVFGGIAVVLIFVFNFLYGARMDSMRAQIDLISSQYDILKDKQGADRDRADTADRDAETLRNYIQKMRQEPPPKRMME